MGAVRSGAGGNGMNDFEKYNSALGEYNACLFITLGGFGWYYNGKAKRGFKTPEEAYEDCCREIENN